MIKVLLYNEYIYRCLLNLSKSQKLLSRLERHISNIGRYFCLSQREEERDEFIKITSFSFIANEFIFDMYFVPSTL